MKTFLVGLLLFVVTAAAEILGCYSVYSWLKLHRSAWWLLPGAFSLALFAWLLALHPTVAGRTYAAYGGVYIAASLVWLKWVDGHQPDRWDFLGAAFCLLGAAIILFPHYKPETETNNKHRQHNMNNITKTLTLIIALAVGLPAARAAEKIQAGPKGGRLLEKTSPKAEFFVEKDQTVTIAFYDEKLKPVPAGEQQVTVVAGKQKLEFEKKGDVLASKGKLPEGDGYQVAVQYREKPDAKPQNIRFKYDAHTCGECKRAEYACTCDH